MTDRAYLRSRLRPTREFGLALPAEEVMICAGWLENRWAAMVEIAQAVHGVLPEVGDSEARRRVLAVLAKHELTHGG